MNETIFYLSLVVAVYLVMIIIDIRRLARFIRVHLVERWSIAEFIKSENSKRYS